MTHSCTLKTLGDLEHFDGGEGIAVLLNEIARRVDADPRDAGEVVAPGEDAHVPARTMRSKLITTGTTGKSGDTP